MDFMDRLRALRRDREGVAPTGLLIGMVVFVVIAFALYPLVGGYVSDFTNASSDNYVGADSAGIVGMVPIFYWLGVALTVIGVALYAIKDSL